MDDMNYTKEEVKEIIHKIHEFRKEGIDDYNIAYKLGMEFDEYEKFKVMYMHGCNKNLTPKYKLDPVLPFINSRRRLTSILTRTLAYMEDAGYDRNYARFSMDEQCGKIPLSVLNGLKIPFYDDIEFKNNRKEYIEKMKIVRRMYAVEHKKISDIAKELGIEYCRVIRMAV